MWKPCGVWASRPLTSPEIDTGAVGSGWVNVTVPLTDPLRTTTAYGEDGI